MKIRRSAIAACLAVLALASPATANVPSGGSLHFDVVRNGKDIGDVSYVFRGNTDQLQVQVNTDVAVQVPLLGTKLYRFEQTSTEQWSNGQLASLNSRTNDNGDAHNISAGATQLIPASLWNAKIVNQSQLLNTIDGSVMSVHFVTVGTEGVAAKGGNVQATHYRMTGDLARDLWFDGAGELVRVQFVAEDGTQVTYVRR